MQSLSESRTAEPYLDLKASLLLLSVALNALEFFIPRIPLLPWLKPGLANIVTVVWLVRFGTLDTLLFSVLRIWIVGFYFGFSILTLALGLSGAVAATLCMALAWNALGRRGLLGLIGLGMIGACAHNAGQLAAVYALFARNPLVLYQLPAMAIASMIAGAAVGALSYSLLASSPDSPPRQLSRTPLARPATRLQGFACLALLGWSVAVMLFEAPRTLLWHAAAATLLVQLTARGSLRALLAPIRSFWVLLLMVAVVHLLFTHGRRVPEVPFVTYEGARESARQLLRLWTWLQLSQVLKRSGFGAWTMSLLSRLLPDRHETLAAGLVALEYFPDTLSWARKAVGPAMLRLARSPRSAARSFAADLHHDLLEQLRE